MRSPQEIDDMLYGPSISLVLTGVQIVARSMPWALKVLLLAFYFLLRKKLKFIYYSFTFKIK